MLCTNVANIIFFCDELYGLVIREFREFSLQAKNLQGPFWGIAVFPRAWFWREASPKCSLMLSWHRTGNCNAFSCSPQVTPKIDMNRNTILCLHILFLHILYLHRFTNEKEKLGFLYSLPVMLKTPVSLKQLLCVPVNKIQALTLRNSLKQICNNRFCKILPLYPDPPEKLWSEKNICWQVECANTTSLFPPANSYVVMVP